MGKGSMDSRLEESNSPSDRIFNSPSKSRSVLNYVCKCEFVLENGGTAAREICPKCWAIDSFVVLSKLIR